MNREQLFASIVAARPGRDDFVFVARRGDEYDWRVIPTGDAMVDPPKEAGPDVWMSFSAAWPVDDEARMRAFLDDVLDEMESMASTADRCRWPLDDPWPHFH